MRSALVFLATISLMGCSSSRVVDATWDEATLADLNRRSGRPSLWVTGDENLTTQRFVVGTDSLLLKTELGLGEAQVTGNESLVRLGGDVHYWRLLRPDSIDEIRFDRRNRGRGFRIGGSVGALAGGLFLGWVSRGMSDCILVKYGGDRSCHVEAFFDGFLIGAPLGGLATGLIGALVGKKETTIYRFRPDTPQQMSVVIGVGPTSIVPPTATYSSR